jgi:hypothetical protein
LTLHSAGFRCGLVARRNAFDDAHLIPQPTINPITRTIRNLSATSRWSAP